MNTHNICIHCLHELQSLNHFPNVFFNVFIIISIRINDHAFQIHCTKFIIASINILIIIFRRKDLECFLCGCRLHYANAFNLFQIICDAQIAVKNRMMVTKMYALFIVGLWKSRHYFLVHVHTLSCPLLPPLTTSGAMYSMVPQNE